MSEFDNDGGSLEGMINQRSENSVLFSLDSLSAAEEAESGSSEDFAFGGSGDESGLIDLNTLARLGAAGSESAGDTDSMPALFQSAPKRSSHKGLFIALGIVGFLVLVAVGVYVAYDYVTTKDKAAAEAQAKKDAELAKKEEELKLALDQAQRAELEKQQLQNQQNNQLNDDRLKQIAEEEKNKLQANNTDDEGKKRTHRSGGSGSSGNSASAGDTAAPPAPKPAGGKPDANAVKAALGESAKKAMKCGKGGNLTVSFTLNPNGKASNVQAVGGSFKGTATEACIIKVVQVHNFPTYKGASVPGVKFTYKM